MDALYSILIFLLFAFFAAFLAAYILKAKALSRMARNAGMARPGLAWLPVANNWLLGSLCERSARFQAGKSLGFAKILLALDTVKVISCIYVNEVTLQDGTRRYVYSYNFAVNRSFRSLITVAAALGLLVFSAIALHHLYQDHAPGRETPYTVLSVIFGGIGQSILLFLIRDCIPVSAASRMVPPPPCRKYSQLWRYGPPPWGGAYPPPGQSGPGTTGWGQQPYQSGPGTTGWSQQPPQGGARTTGWNQPSQAPNGPGTTGWTQPPPQGGEPSAGPPPEGPGPEQQ